MPVHILKTALNLFIAAAFLGLYAWIDPRLLPVGVVWVATGLSIRTMLWHEAGGIARLWSWFGQGVAFWLSVYCFGVGNTPMALVVGLLPIVVVIAVDELSARLQWTRTREARSFEDGAWDHAADAPPSQRWWTIAMLFAAGWVLFLGLAVRIRPAWVIVLGLLLLLVTAVVVMRLGGSLFRLFRASPLFAVVVWGTLIMVGLRAFEGMGVLPPFNEDYMFRVSEPRPGPDLTPSQKTAAVELVEAVLAGERPDASSLNDVDAEHGAVLTLYRIGAAGRTRAQAQGPLGDALVEAASQAAKQAPWTSRSRVQIQLPGPDERIVRAQRLHAFITDSMPERVSEYVMAWAPWSATWIKLGVLPWQFEPGVDGLRLEIDGENATFMPGDAVTQGFLTPRKTGRTGKIRTSLNQLAGRLGPDRFAWQKPGTELRRFRSTDFGRPVADGPVRDFYRGNVLLDGLDLERVLQAREEGVLWLANAVGPDGRFQYEYLPNEDRWADSYNIVRHAGSIYGLLHAWHQGAWDEELADDRDLILGAALRALDYLYPVLDHPDRAEGFDEATARARVAAPDFEGDLPVLWDPAAAPKLLAIIDQRPKRTVVETGSAALALLAMSELPGPDEVTDPAHKALLARPEIPMIRDGLARFLIECTDDRGALFHFWDQAKTLDQVEKEPPYYPGEAILALTRLYRVDPNPEWLAGAEKIAERQERMWLRFGGFPDHWVMQGFDELYRMGRGEHWGRTSVAMAEYSARLMFPPNRPPFDDYVGAWRRATDVPRCTRAGSRAEAMTGSLHSAWALGVDATRIEDALIATAEHIVEQQFRPENSWFLPNPDPALGCFRMGIVDNMCRIDNNQHVVVGLLGVVESLKLREGRALPVVYKVEEVRPE